MDAHQVMLAQQQRTIRILALAQVLNGLGVAGTVAAGSLLVSSITDSETLAGLAQTSSVLGAAALAIPLARLTARGGRRLALSVGYLSGVLGSILAIIGGSSKLLPFMLIGTFFVGAASAAGYQARFAAIDLASDDHRARHLSFVVWGLTIGAVIGPNLMDPSGRLAELLGLPHLVGPYLISTVTLLLSTLVIQFFLKPDPYLTARTLRGEAGSERREIKKALRHIAENPRALFAILAISTGHIAMVTIMVMTPVHMKHVDVTLTIIGLVISIHVLGMYAFSPLVGSLSDRIGRIHTIRIGVLTLLIASFVAGRAHADDAIQLGIGLFLLGLGWSFTLIAGSTFLTESVTQELKASAQGASDLVMNLSGAFGGAIAGVVIATLSYGWLCALAAIPVSLLGIWSLRVVKANRN